MATRGEAEQLSDARTLDDRYELIRLVGSGGMAEVWRARDRRLGRDVAVKLLSGSATEDASRRRRIQREARALAAGTHPNIVSIYDHGEAADHGDGVRPYIVMELVEGPDLHQVLTDRGPLPVGEVRDLLLGVLGAVECAHAAGVVHGDLKPANVIVGAHGPKVGDFGVARILEQETGTTTLAATPSFAAPEVLRGERPTKASDIYSIGCLAFQMLAARPPFEGANGWEVAQKHAEAPVPSVGKLRSDVPPDLDRAIARAMDKEPRRRFADAGAFAEALGAVPLPGAVATVPVGAGAPPAPEATEALAGRPDLGRVALLGALAGTWTRLERGGRRAASSVAAYPKAMLAGLLVLALLLTFLVVRDPGADLVNVPDVRGRTMQDAAAQLRMSGFRLNDVSFRPVAGTEAGHVVDTIPAPGSEVDPGSVVHMIAAALAATPEPERVRDADDDDDEGGGGKGRKRNRERGGGDD